MPRSLFHHRVLRLAALLVAVGTGGASEAQTSRDPFLATNAFVAFDDDPVVRTAQYDLENPLRSDDGAPLDLDVTVTDYHGGFDGYSTRTNGRFWQLLPDGLIYRSYLAGPREPRIGTQLFHNSATLENSQGLWDGTVGGRRGLLRFGTGDPLKPEGWQLDVEGAAIVRLNLREDRDLDASDFRFGFPLTYGEGKVQYKFGYYHLSSHLGDEFIVRTGGNPRVNYVRDAIIWGVSYNPNPCWRIYGETAWAFFTSGGAEPWEFQFGLEYSRPGPTTLRGTPFFATNAHLREEVNFGGDWTTQIGWLWRGTSGSTFRVGLHYVNGKSTQYQFFDDNEEQVGIGFWYDF